MEDHFLTMEQYLDGARNILARYSGSPNVVNNEDAIAYVAEYMMRADSRYKPEIGDRDGFRGHWGRFGVMNWIKRSQNKKAIKYSLDYSYDEDGDNNLELINLIPDKKQNTEHKIEAIDIVETVRYSNRINDRQRTCILEYYVNNHSRQTIANIIGISQQSVDNNIKSGLRKIKYQMGYVND